MQSGDIQPQQARVMQEQVRRHLAYMGRLRRRMEVRGFPPDDPVYRSVSRCFDALQDLHVRAHYLGCTTGVAKGM